MWPLKKTRTKYELYRKYREKFGLSKNEDDIRKKNNNNNNWYFDLKDFILYRYIRKLYTVYFGRHRVVNTERVTKLMVLSL